MTKTKPTVDLGYPTEARGRIPSFSTIEEEAHWWDTHDSAEYDEEFVPVELVVGPDFGSVLRIPLEADEIDELNRRAGEMDVDVTTLARMWIREQLKREAS